jgi:biotin transport system substrate-specific component
MIPDMNARTRHAGMVASASAGRRVWLQATGVVGFALLTAAGAHLVVPVPGSPVPITLQTLFVLLAGMTLGPRLGVLSMGFYLVLGMTGYHVFAAASWSQGNVFGATGGYLIGFVLAQPVIGALTRRSDSPRPSLTRLSVTSNLVAAALAGNLIIFTIGLAWLQLWMSTAPAQTLAMGLWPFVPGLVLKTAAAVAGGYALQPLARRIRTS